MAFLMQCMILWVVVKFIADLFVDLKMLNLVPSQRLGYSVNGGRAIMKHVFYKVTAH